MDRRAIARARRHRMVSDRLEEERGRELALVEVLEEAVTELEGPALDAIVLAGLSPEDAAVVRDVVEGGVEIDLGDEEDFFDGLDFDGLDDEEGEPHDPAAGLEDEIARLQEAIEESRARQRALQAYLDALPDA